jgi:3-dehydroquinate dehydratase type I
MKMFATVLEETFDEALEVIRTLDTPVELRAEKLARVDLRALRAATRNEILLTYRGSRVPDVRAALAAGIDYVDVEWPHEAEVPERTVYSHHDYEGMRDLNQIVPRMRAANCAHTKVAATPRNFAENQELLAYRGISAIGMGERGLYARILAPFRGAELTFVAARAAAAPGQLTLERARGIFWDVRAEKVFAVLGNPAGHSLSPVIHNRLFREKNVPAAYTIASFETFEEITDGFLGGDPCGLSVTAPFKDAAFAFASAIGGKIAPNAERARAVNTLVNVAGRIVADNTDVDGFAALIPRDARKAAILGAGGTARAAGVALEDLRIPFTIYNRTAERGDAPLDALQSTDADLIINTLPPGVNVAIPPCRTYIQAAYGGVQQNGDAQHSIDGLALLHAQARRQHELFMEVFNG